MKRKVIKVEYRKDSESFPEWLKYEITILNENGLTEKVPAYGKDLQDALSRIVHDERAEKIKEKAEKTPLWIWALVFLGYLTLISTWSVNNNQPIVVIVGLLSVLAIIFGVNKMLQKRNRNKLNYE